jgi:hypothetical protein
MQNRRALDAFVHDELGKLVCMTRVKTDIVIADLKTSTQIPLQT